MSTGTHLALLGFCPCLYSTAIGEMPGLKGCLAGCLRVVSTGDGGKGGRLLPEETLAALTSQGMEVVACGLVPTHHTVSRLIFPASHGFRG